MQTNNIIIKSQYYKSKYNGSKIINFKIISKEQMIQELKTFVYSQ